MKEHTANTAEAGKPCGVGGEGATRVPRLHPALDASAKQAGMLADPARHLHHTDTSPPGAGRTRATLESHSGAWFLKGDASGRPSQPQILAFAAREQSGPLSLSAEPKRNHI